MSPDATIAAALLLPAAGALGVALTGRSPTVRETVTLLTSLATVVLVASLAAPVAAGLRPELHVGAVLPGITLAFALEPLGMVYALVASGLWVVTSLYAIGYMRAHHEQDQTRFFACFALAISAALGIAFAKNLFTLFFFYEVLTFSTYPLVTHHGTPEALRAGRIYLGILVFTSVVFLLFAIAWTWRLAGTLDFRGGGLLAGRLDPAMAPLLLGLYAFGAGKAALMPLHRWLPNAMVAPTPVSALLHAVAVVKAGVFTILKVVVYVFGLDFLSATAASEWLMYVAAFTALMAAAIAITQDNLKARLAYSTISHLAYIVLGAALATKTSVIGGALHIAMHAFGKITLFFCAGALYVTAHKTRVSELDGIGRRMPFTMAAFFVASLSLIGLPPLGGMWSKWFIALGALQGGTPRPLFAAVLMLTSLLSIAYLMPVVVRAFFAPLRLDVHGHSGQSPRPHLEILEAPWLCVVPLCLTALASLALFFFAEPLHTLLLSLFETP